MAGESVMSQEEIDALIGNSPDPAPAPTPVAAAPPVAAPPPVDAPPPPAPVASSSIQSPVDLTDIYDRLENLEKAARRVGELDRAQYEFQLTTRQIQHDVKTVAAQLQQVAAQMKVIMSNLQATPGYGAMKTHKCASCGTKGAAAIPIKCTKCGKTSYKGRAAPGGTRSNGARLSKTARPSSAGTRVVRGAGRRPVGNRPK